MSHRVLLFSIVLALTAIASWWVLRVAQSERQQSAPADQGSLVNPQPPAPSTATRLIEPVSSFQERSTKKRFGTYVEPGNSPVKSERFKGFHTGVDAEFAEVTGVVAVHAITDGTVLSSRRADGYGGVTAITHVIDGVSHVGVYGHLQPDTLLPVGTEIRAGDQIGELGEGGSSATDGERKHLHFSLVRGTSPDLRGYVQTKEELGRWRDPLELSLEELTP